MPCQLTIRRTVNLPDPLRLARLARAPELGPRILFFSGGSALNPLCRVLTDYTHNSVHLITPFDSGGSSAKLRQAFRMPAVGDLRNRLMALADQSVTGNPEVGRLFSYRLPRDTNPGDLARRLDGMVRGDDPLVAAVPDPLRKIIRAYLGDFNRARPADFDLRGASIGNLVLTGGYLKHDRHLDAVTYLFGELAKVRGVVRTVVNQDLHLVAELADGRIVKGQHRLTGREVPPIESPVMHIYLTNNLLEPRSVRPKIRRKTIDLIRSAELICYPVGSFYSSLIASILPDGVGRTIAATNCPKVYVPNTTTDPEFPVGGVERAVKILLDRLGGQEPGGTGERVLDFVLLDTVRADYRGRPDLKDIEALGATVIDTHLVTSASHPYVDPRLLAEVILSMT